LPSSRIRRAGWTLCLAIAFAAGLASPATAKVYLSRREALAWAFPQADRIDERSHVLTREQAQLVESRAGAKLDSRIVKLYTAYLGDEVQGYAFIDIHTVRTLPEAFLVVLTPEGEVRTLRVLAFYEPSEYLPPERWLEQFDRRRLDDQTHVGGAIHGIAGSTLSANAVTGGVRRSLALYEVLVKGHATVSQAPPPDTDLPHPGGGH
jgi:hypothetical protein